MHRDVSTLLPAPRFFAVAVIATTLGILGPATTRAGAQPCDDLRRCTVDDVCGDGICSGIPVECPDDGDACTRERCVVASGICQRETVHCEGPCRTGACDPLTGCVPRPDGSPCDDGKTCTTNDESVSGFCHGMPVEEGTPCIDALGPCTVLDRCVRGNCIGDFRTCPDSDHDACTPEFCDFLSGACITLPRLECFDACTEGICNPETGRCPTRPDGLPCDDGNLCTPTDRCVDGECVGFLEIEIPTATPTNRPTTEAPATATAPRTATPTRSLTPAPTGNSSAASGGCAVTPAGTPRPWFGLAGLAIVAGIRFAKRR